jgi:1-deoxy-D-xylulose-5-phosphate synthase
VDAGIAEEHAVSFAAGLALGGYKPVFAVYSSFLQRAYDQILEDVCLQNLPVVFAIDRAGLVGSDGETHQGIFDISYMSSMPNMHIMAPKNKWELSDMLKFALTQDRPMAIRYPRGEAYAGLQDFRAVMEYGKAELLYAEGDICLLAVGSMVETAIRVRELLREKGQKCSIVNARFVKPIDEYAVKWASDNHSVVVTMEENVYSGGYGEKVRQYLDETEDPAKLINIALPDDYVEHGNPDKLKQLLKIDAQSIADRLLGLHSFR